MVRTKKQIIAQDFPIENQELTNINIRALNKAVTKLAMANMVIESVWEEFKSRDWTNILSPSQKQFVSNIAKNHKTAFCTDGIGGKGMTMDLKEYMDNKNNVAEFNKITEFVFNKEPQFLDQTLELIELADGLDHVNMLKFKSWLMVANPKFKEKEV